MLMLIAVPNAKGGLLGKQPEAVVVDPAPDWPLFAERARELLPVIDALAASGDPVAAAVLQAWGATAKDPRPEALTTLRAAIDTEADPVLKAQKQRLERLLTQRCDPSFATRVAFAGDPAPDVNLARSLRPGRALPEAEA